MREYEIYLPTNLGNGCAIDESAIHEIKEELAHAFGGYTEVTQRCEGVWKVDGATFREEISILRVLDDGSAEFDMLALKTKLERTLKQERVLITVREVESL